MFSSKEDPLPFCHIHSLFISMILFESACFAFTGGPISSDLGTSLKLFLGLVWFSPLVYILNKFEAVTPKPSLADSFGFLVFLIDFLTVVGFSYTIYKLDYDKTTGAATLVSFSPLLYILNKFKAVTPIPSLADPFDF